MTPGLFSSGKNMSTHILKQSLLVPWQLFFFFIQSKTEIVFFFFFLVNLTVHHFERSEVKISKLPNTLHEFIP